MDTEPIFTAGLSTADVAKRLGVSKRFVQDLITRGRLQAAKVGRDWRVSVQQLAAFKPLPRGRPYKGTVETVVVKHGFKLEAAARGRRQRSTPLWIEELQTHRRRRVRLPGEAQAMRAFIARHCANDADPDAIMRTLVKGTRWERLLPYGWPFRVVGGGK
jgi:excisionase family DNA binding protein